ncbi:MAG TPA: hypothetical protein VF599_10215 [Pyrinomonadaceae bacterium]
MNQAIKLWYNFEPVNGASFGLNDYVRVKSGELAGQGASVISLIKLEPVTYLVELDCASGGDIVIAGSEIESA